MPKIKTVKEYREKLDGLNEEGRRATEKTSARHRHLEGETADYAQHLHHAETKGRPVAADKPKR